MKKISFVSSCFNEEGNVEELFYRVKSQIEKFPAYDWEYIILDNGSTDDTAKKLEEIAANDKHLKVIINARNFGHIRSPYYGICRAKGDAVIYLASDLQDPPELIEEFIRKWEDGFKIVLGQKNSSDENPIMFFIRKLYYKGLRFISDDGTTLLENCTGFGLYDKVIIDIVRENDDSYPYMRGQICDIGFEKAFVRFNQPTRKRGLTKNNFYTLYDNAMLGVVKHSKMPLRIMTFIGFLTSFLSILLAILYLVLKILFWQMFNFGLAPLIISIFFFASVQLFCLGIIGEYIGAIYTRVDKKPLVVAMKEINFEE